MRIKPKPLVGLLLNPFGIDPRSIEYHNDELQVAARRGRGIPIANLATAPIVNKGFVSSTLQIVVDDGTRVTLRGARHSDATTFGETVKADWIAYNTARFENERPAINAILRIITDLSEPSRYPSSRLAMTGSLSTGLPVQISI